MTTLLENPMPILFCGLAVEAILGAIFLGNRRVVFLIPMAGVLALMLLGVAIERLVVTPREEVEMTLDNLADALEANDVARVLGHISPSAASTRSRAQWAMDRFRVSKAKVSSLKITVNELTSPPSAKAAFDGLLTLSDRKGELTHTTYMIAFTAEFRKEGDRWLVTNHVEDVPTLGGKRE